ncbi:hypothetical protein GGS20DRAFT_41933 [Poronia punctata]|nr:hypothetical protein GGS20DRAFT_41933 [Poronia punctata]
MPMQRKHATNLTLHLLSLLSSTLIPVLLGKYCLGYLPGLEYTRFQSITKLGMFQGGNHLDGWTVVIAIAQWYLLIDQLHPTNVFSYPMPTRTDQQTTYYIKRLVNLQTSECNGLEIHDGLLLSTFHGSTRVSVCLPSSHRHDGLLLGPLRWVIRRCAVNREVGMLM